LAKVHKANDGRQHPVVVKFVYSHRETYGTTVHQYLHEHGLAPRLYAAENLHRGVVMIVMEHLHQSEDGTGSWVELDTFERKLGTNAAAVRQKLEEILSLLQSQKMVHADFRAVNIMVKVDMNGDIVITEEGPVLSVIDFDWAGTAGQVCYPPFLNPSIPWPTGAKPYQKIGENDDKNLLNNWWAKFVKGRS
jgi:hypothetical protein